MQQAELPIVARTHRRLERAGQLAPRRLAA
jgi:hypothetical protein